MELQRSIVRRATALVVLALVGHGACAQDYPRKLIRVLATEAGGGGDIVMRLAGPEVASALGQQVVVENRNTIIASELAAKAPADGYTLLINSSSMWLAPFLRNDVPWDPLRDFAPVTLTVRIPGVLVVHPSLRLKSVSELVALAKSRPGQLNYSNVSAGGPNLLATVLFTSMAGINVVRVNYKGTTAALTGLLTGDTQMAFANAGSVMPYIKSGKLTALAVTTARPSPVAPGLPTIAAAGLPGYESESIAGCVRAGRHSAEHHRTAPP